MKFVSLGNHFKKLSCLYCWVSIYIPFTFRLILLLLFKAFDFLSCIQYVSPLFWQILIWRLCFICKSAAAILLAIVTEQVIFIQVLSDDEKRSLYDKYGEAGLKGAGMGMGVS